MKHLMWLLLSRILVPHDYILKVTFVTFFPDEKCYQQNEIGTQPQHIFLGPLQAFNGCHYVDPQCVCFAFFLTLPKNILMDRNLYFMHPAGFPIAQIKYKLFELIFSLLFN